MMPEHTATPYLRPALATALTSALLGCLITCAFVALGSSHDRSGSFLGVLQGGIRAWLVSHGSGLTANGLTISIIPLGAVLIAFAIVYAATRYFVREPLDDPGPFVGVVAGTYGLIAAILSAGTSFDGYSTSLIRATVGAFVIAASAAILGSAVPHGGVASLLGSTHASIRSIIAAAWFGLASMLLCCLGIVVLLLFLHLQRAGDLWASLGPGILGGLGLAVVCLVALPNLVLWSASVLLGPGFALGTNTSLDLTGAHLGAVPGLPLLAALPNPGAFPEWAFLLGLIPLAAGALSGWMVNVDKKVALPRHIGFGAAAGALAGATCGLLIALSGGALGPGRMSEAGPPTLTPLFVAVGVFALGGAIGASVGHYRGVRASNSPIGRPRLRQRN